MARPLLGIQVEPVESSNAIYLPLAPTTSSGQVNTKLVLRIRIQNNSDAALKVIGIRFSFPGTPHVDVDMQGVNMDGGLDLNPKQAAFWSNGQVDLDPDPNVDKTVNNAIFLPPPSPTQVKVLITCKSIANPAIATYQLKPPTSPVPAKFYRFPYAAGELRSDEYYQTSAVHWANGGPAGNQIYAHDIGIVGWDGKWSGLLPGKDGSKNEDYRIYNKPVRAIANGTVSSWLDTMDENTVLGKFPNPTPSPVTGNHIIVQHGTELVQYCHFRKGTIPAPLKTVGAVVFEGQELGRAGNSGNSTNPHTHIETARASDGALRPFVFRSAWIIDTSSLSPPGSGGPWFHLTAHGIPKVPVAIWPASTFPGFPVPTTGFSIAGDWANRLFVYPDVTSFSNAAQNMFDKEGLRLIRVATYLENGARRWVGIARSGDWANWWWISTSLASFKQTAQDLFDSKGLRPIYVNTFIEGGTRKWIGISRGGDWANRLIIKDNLAAFATEAQSLFDTQGLRLTNVTTWLQGSTRMWLGIARSGNWANRWWISPDLGSFATKVQQLFDTEGKRLNHITTYVQNGQRNWVGIARSGDWGHRWFYRSDFDSFSLEGQRLFDQSGLRLDHIDFLE
jgi:hypothetical protein